MSIERLQRTVEESGVSKASQRFLQEQRNHETENAFQLERERAIERFDFLHAAVESVPPRQVAEDVIRQSGMVGPSSRGVIHGSSYRDSGQEFYWMPAIYNSVYSKQHSRLQKIGKFFTREKPKVGMAYIDFVFSECFRDGLGVMVGAYVDAEQYTQTKYFAEPVRQRFHFNWGGNSSTDIRTLRNDSWPQDMTRGSSLAFACYRDSDDNQKRTLAEIVSQEQDFDVKKFIKKPNESAYRKAKIGMDFLMEKNIDGKRQGRVVLPEDTLNGVYASIRAAEYIDNGLRSLDAVHLQKLSEIEIKGLDEYVDIVSKAIGAVAKV